MNIKSLLLGSAAAMVAVSGAQAADAVVVEPEPVEYVRVCDAYGSGFFYIPGTETCLKFSGYVRSVWKSNTTTTHNLNDQGNADATDDEVTKTEDSKEDWTNRGRVIVTTNSETDWGTLSGLFRFEGNQTGKTANSNMKMNRALISLAGFRVGLGANYWTTNHGFASLDFEGINGEGGYYYGSTTSASLFDYTWAADGLSITAGVQNTSNNVNAVLPAAAPANNSSPYDIYAGFNYSADFGSIAATWIQDADGGQAGELESGSAWKVSATFDISEVVPGGVLHAMYLTDGDDKTEYVNGGTFGTNTESMWSIGAQMDLTDELVLAANYYDVSEDKAGGGKDGSLIGVGLTWRPAAAPGLKIYGTYTSTDFDEMQDFGALGTAAVPRVQKDGFALAIRRSF